MRVEDGRRGGNVKREEGSKSEKRNQRIRGRDRLKRVCSEERGVKGVEVGDAFKLGRL